MNGSISGTNRGGSALWSAVERLVGAEYELAGELSASVDGHRAAYIATRRTPGRELKLLVVERGADPDAYDLSVQDRLDETVPAQDLYCRHCGNRLETWAAVCSSCGRDPAVTMPFQGQPLSDSSLRSAVVSALGPDSTPLGSLPTASGSLAVFARTAKTGEVVALSLERIGGATGPARAVPIARLRRYTGPAVVTPAPLATPPESAPTRPQSHRPESAATVPAPASSPHSGEIGPLTEADRALVSDFAMICPQCRSRFEPGNRYCPVDGSELREVHAHPDLVGRVVGGKFRVEALLGQGGMGRVYLAEHLRIGRRCALKVLAPNLVGDPSSIRRFALEARNASRIVHPNVAVVYDFEETPDGLVYLVLEYVDGETLAAMLGRSEHQRLDVMRAIRMASDVADALQAAHDLGIVHRDLKPDNVMIARAPSGADIVKVVDFGIAKAIETTPGTGVTRTGFVVGTPRYMSPEQLAGAHVDALTDIYALGCVLYEAVTGRPAYDAPITTERAVRQQPKFREDAPRELDTVITRAMARKAEARYQTARDMREALDALLVSGRATSRRALFVRTAVGVGALALAAAAGLIIVNRRSPAPPQHQSAPAANVAPVPAAPEPVPSASTTPAANTPAANTPAANKPAANTPAANTPAAGTPAGSTPVVNTPAVRPKPSRPVEKPGPAPAPVTPAPTPASPEASAPAAAAPVESDAATTTAVDYLTRVRRVIRERWLDALQGYQPNGGERAEFNVVIDETGRVLELTPIAVSNQAAYDDPTESALQRIATFGAPPPHVGRELRVIFHGATIVVQAGSLTTP